MEAEGWVCAGSKGKFSSVSDERCSPSFIVTVTFHSRESRSKLRHYPAKHKYAQVSHICKAVSRSRDVCQSAEMTDADVLSLERNLPIPC